jgi:hypothetical protein
LRDYRLSQLVKEEETWYENIQDQANITPELTPLLLLRVEDNP